ncbi:MAG: hypothetical protein OJF49_004645 [Ktedonobacterales bacterium]|nr:MAG: hypothetical protein OJF49_004645 [Ktedonobacterales bacterium]
MDCAEPDEQSFAQLDKRLSETVASVSAYVNMLDIREALRHATAHS